MSSTNNDLRVFILGDDSTGRTTIRNYCVGNHLDQDVIRILGSNFVKTHRAISGKTYEIELWKFIGERNAHQVRVQLLYGFDAGIVVFDVTNRHSFDSILDWIEVFWRTWGNFPVPTLLVANKCDLRTVTSVPLSMVTQLADILSTQVVDRGFSVNVVETGLLDRTSLDMAIQKLLEVTAKLK